MNQRPLFVVPGHRRFAVFFERVIFPLPAGLAFAPARLDQPPVFHPVQHRVQHAVRPLELAIGAGLDLLDDGVTVALTFGEQRQNQRFRRRRNQFFSNHRDTIHRVYMYVKRENWLKRNSCQFVEFVA